MKSDMTENKFWEVRKMQVNIQQAHKEFAGYVHMLETGQEPQIIFARHGKPVARLTLCGTQPVARRIGVAKGLLSYPDDLDQFNDEILELFGETE